MKACRTDSGDRHRELVVAVMDGTGCTHAEAMMVLGKVIERWEARCREAWDFGYAAGQKKEEERKETMEPGGFHHIKKTLLDEGVDIQVLSDMALGGNINGEIPEAGPYWEDTARIRRVLDEQGICIGTIEAAAFWEWRSKSNVGWADIYSDSEILEWWWEFVWHELEVVEVSAVQECMKSMHATQTRKPGGNDYSDFVRCVKPLIAVHSYHATGAGDDSTHSNP